MLAFVTYAWDLIVKGAMASVGFLRGLTQGGERTTLTLLLVLMAADYATGVLSGALRKSAKTPHGGLSSSVGMRGLTRKALVLLVVLLAQLLDRSIGDGTTMFRSTVTWFYLTNEAISLLENLALCGVPIPKRLRAMLEQLREEKGDGEKPRLPDEADAKRRWATFDSLGKQPETQSGASAPADQPSQVGGASAPADQPLQGGGASQSPAASPDDEASTPAPPSASEGDDDVREVFIEHTRLRLRKTPPKSRR